MYIYNSFISFNFSGCNCYCFCGYIAVNLKHLSIFVCLKVSEFANLFEAGLFTISSILFCTYYSFLIQQLQIYQYITYYLFIMY